MTERFPLAAEQLAIISEHDILEIQDLEQLADIRRHLFQTAVSLIARVNDITKVLKEEGYEKGARLRKITGPEAIDMEARDE